MVRTKSRKMQEPPHQEQSGKLKPRRKTDGEVTAGYLKLSTAITSVVGAGWQSGRKSRISIYVCGVTVHDSYHVGHLRTFLSFEIIIRWLRQLGYSTFLVRNITDLDDRTLNQTDAKGDFWNRAETMVTRLRKEMGPFGADCPNWEPRVTKYVGLILKAVRKLVKLKSALPTASGNVIFRPSNPEPVQSGSGSHFSVWKASPEEKRQLGWLSPYGLGKPGWHLECSTMCYHSFGWGVSLHGGGQDLRFPHHRNEMELNDALFYQGYVRSWVHSGLVLVGDAKMADSACNAKRLGQQLGGFSSGTVRLYLLSSHYSSPLEYGWEHLQRAERIFQKMREVSPSIVPAEKWQSVDWNERGGQQFRSWMNQDVSTSSAILVLLSSFRSASKRRSIPLLRQCTSLAGILGLDSNLDTVGKLVQSHSLLTDLLVESHILSRCWARTYRHYQLADSLRLGLKQLGAVLTDNQDISGWSWFSASAGH